MSSCGATCGINRERERERELALAAVVRAFPGFAWCAPHMCKVSHVAFGVASDAIVDLGRALEELLPVRAIFRPGDAGACDWLYLLAGFASPSLIEVADGARMCRDSTAAEIHETYVRLGFSPLGRYVTIQEVVARAMRGADALDSDSSRRIISIEPQMGVADRRLQAIVKGLQGKLRRERLIVLDMAFLAQPIAEIAPHATRQNEFIDAFGTEPCLFSFLFDPAPPSAMRAVFE
jgi:hypothetical protein